MINSTTGRVLLWLKHLDPTIRPAHVTRYGETTGIAAHPDALRAEVAMWAADTLTDAERLALRDAFDQPDDLSIPVDDRLLDGTMRSLVIPDEIALPAALKPEQDAGADVRELEALWQMSSADR